MKTSIALTQLFPFFKRTRCVILNFNFNLVMLGITYKLKLQVNTYVFTTLKSYIYLQVTIAYDDLNYTI